MSVSENSDRCCESYNSSTEQRRRSRGATLSWRNLSVYAMDHGRRNICKQLIDNVRGVAKPGHLTAIIGASGAGKSSLMTALAFRTGRKYARLILFPSLLSACSSPIDAKFRSFVAEVLIRGDIKVNGASINSSYMMLNSGYMHQEDMFVETMTVVEHLWFMARMKVNEKMHTSHVREKIDRLLQDVGLANRRNVRIGNGIEDKVLSGGEKKRLAFATELLTDPEILFLDEPTTGQDSHAANSLVFQLKSFASQGRTVLCTIHQPSSAIFNSFDRIILIAEGRVAFAGCTERAIQFFARKKEWRYCSRLYWLTYRYFLQVWRDPSVQIVRIFQKVSVATIAGLCFLGSVKLDQLGIQATQGVLFILVSENAFFPMYATLALIPQELPLLRREYRAGMYPLHLYYVARILSLASKSWFGSLNSTTTLGEEKNKRRLLKFQIPGLIAEALLFTTIIYWLSGLRESAEVFGSTLIVLLLTINVSTACGCFFSTAFDNVPLAMAYLVPFDYILMITMGPFLKLGSLPIYIRWVKYISWLLHSSEALTIVQWTGVHNISCKSIDSELPCITEGFQVLQRYDFDEANFWMDTILMIIIYLVFHVLGYVCLWNRCRWK
ncbi:protein scarlet-like isoform X8 [Calliopsis andreniformis]|uniref:protein scarlet-like isoform X8 n=1 Tax=Calliopsis andreniformis TaxID=337506 RepID=UPI003FCCBF42